MSGTKYDVICITDGLIYANNYYAKKLLIIISHVLNPPVASFLHVYRHCYYIQKIFCDYVIIVMI